MAREREREGEWCISHSAHERAGAVEEAEAEKKRGEEKRRKREPI